MTDFAKVFIHADEAWVCMECGAVVWRGYTHDGTGRSYPEVHIAFHEKEVSSEED
jgi:uncharacterized protein with PIN domain